MALKRPVQNLLDGALIPQSGKAIDPGLLIGFVQLADQLYLHIAELSQVQFGLCPAGDIGQCRKVVFAERAWLGVNDAQRANILFAAFEQVAGIKTRIRRACHVGVIGKAWILSHIFTNQIFVFQQSVLAQGIGTRGVDQVETMNRLEPLGFIVNERQVRNRNIK